MEDLSGILNLALEDDGEVVVKPSEQTRRKHTHLDDAGLNNDWSASIVAT